MVPTILLALALHQAIQPSDRKTKASDQLRGLAGLFSLDMRWRLWLTLGSAPLRRQPEQEQFAGIGLAAARRLLRPTKYVHNPPGRAVASGVLGFTRPRAVSLFFQLT